MLTTFTGEFMIKIFQSIVVLFLMVASPLKAQLIPHLNIFKENAPFPGFLYRPNSNDTHSAIIVLHGSEGGNSDFWYEGEAPQHTGESGFMPYMARYYATLGYVTYALCYFDCKHHLGHTSYPPDELKEVDLLRTTVQAMEWLRGSSFVKEKKVFLLGGSRGAEQVVLLASLLAKYKKQIPDLSIPDGVIALSPSQVTIPAFTKEMATSIINGTMMSSSEDKSAWYFGGPIANYEPIEIEEYQGPLLVTYFTDDRVWGPRNNPMKLADRYFQSGVTPKLIKFNENDFAIDHETNSISSLEGQTFIEFNMQGHVYAPYNSEAGNLQDLVVNEFLKQNSN